jgi:hypothetical protein
MEDFKELSELTPDDEIFPSVNRESHPTQVSHKGRKDILDSRSPVE